MTTTHVSGSIKRFWRTTWRYQRTFETPLGKLETFAEVIISALAPIQNAKLIVKGYIFDPKTLRALLAANSLEQDCRLDDCVVAETKAEAAALLRAALADWLDFAFVPSPGPFVIYADHDEYITFLGNTKSNLNRVVEALHDRGFNEVPDYKRSLR